jgi:hypothetical protein
MAKKRSLEGRAFMAPLRPYDDGEPPHCENLMRTSSGVVHQERMTFQNSGCLMLEKQATYPLTEPARMPRTK